MLLATSYATTNWQIGMAVWAFVVGVCIGSFLNVVIYRVPAGLSVIHPPSHCPRCKRPIRWYDNLPVLSWLILRGRCRDCHAPFSGRYALVEFFAGAILALLAFGGILRRYQSLEAVLSDPTWPLVVGRTALVAAGLAALWCAALMAYDGHRPPRWLVLGVLAMAFYGWEAAIIAIVFVVLFLRDVRHRPATFARCYLALAVAATGFALWPHPG